MCVCDKRPHPMMWAAWPATHVIITAIGIPNLNYWVIFIVYSQFTDVPGGRETAYRTVGWVQYFIISTR